MQFYKIMNAGVATFGYGEAAPIGAEVVHEREWQRQRDAAISAASAALLENIESRRPVRLYAARKVLRQMKDADDISYLQRIKMAHEAGDLSDDAFEAIEMLDPVNPLAPPVQEIKAYFEMTDEAFAAMFTAMRAVPV